MRLMCVSKRDGERAKSNRLSLCNAMQCNGMRYLFLESSGGVAPPAHPAEAAGGDEIGAK